MFFFGKGKKYESHQKGLGQTTPTQNIPKNVVNFSNLTHEISGVQNRLVTKS